MDQREQLTALKSSYQESLAAANQRWARAIEAREEETGGPMGGMMMMMGNMEMEMMRMRKNQKDKRDEEKEHRCHIFSPSSFSV